MENYKPNFLGSHAARIARERFLTTCDAVGKLFDVMMGVGNKDLMYSLHPYLWEANEEADALGGYDLGYLFRRSIFSTTLCSLFRNSSSEPYRSCFHQPCTYRGGVVATLQGVV